MLVLVYVTLAKIPQHRTDDAGTAKFRRTCVLGELSLSYVACALLHSFQIPYKHSQ